MKESTSPLTKLPIPCNYLGLGYSLPIVNCISISKKKKKKKKEQKESQLHQLANSKKVNCTIADHNMEYILYKEGKLNKISIGHFWATCTSSISCTFSTFKGNMVVTIKDLLA
jgi:hypothetical protein